MSAPKNGLQVKSSNQRLDWIWPKTYSLKIKLTVCNWLFLLIFFGERMDCGWNQASLCYIGKWFKRNGESDRHSTCRSSGERRSAVPLHRQLLMATGRLLQIQNHLSSSSQLVIASYSSDLRVATIVINNATRANCLSTPVLKALLTALRSINPGISLDSSIDTEDPIIFAERVCRSHSPNPFPKVVILKSAGKIFCSGHDLREFHETHGDYQKVHAIFELCNTVMLAIQRLPQIVISQVLSQMILGNIRYKELRRLQGRN